MFDKTTLFWLILFALSTIAFLVLFIYYKSKKDSKADYFGYGAAAIAALGTIVVLYLYISRKEHPLLAPTSYAESRQRAEDLDKLLRESN